MSENKGNQQPEEPQEGAVAPVYTSQDLYDFIQQQQYDLYNALLRVGRLSHTMFERRDALVHRPQWGITFGQWDLAFLAKSLLLHGTEEGHSPLVGNPLIRCLQLIAGIPDPIIHEPKNAPHRTISSLVRLLYRQLAWQEDPRYWLSRTLFLFDIIPQEEFAQSDFDIRRVFHSIAELSVQEFLVVGFAVWAAATHMNQQFFSPSLLPMDPNFPEKKYGQLLKHLSPTNVSTFLRRLSTDVASFVERDRAERQEASPAYDMYQFNPLFTFPLISLPGEEDPLKTAYVLPIPPLLLERITNGVYWDLMDQDRRNHSRPFATLFGSVFEQYVGRLLKYFFGENSLIPEVQEGDRSCDWILVEGDKAVLIECKTKRITLATRVLGEPERLATDLAQGAAKGLCTIARTRRDVADGTINLAKLKSVERFYHIIIFPDSYYFGNSPWFRDFVTEAVNKGKVRNCTITAVQSLRYHIMSIQELEFFLPVIKERGFAPLLELKESSEQNYYSDLCGFFVELLNGEAIPPNEMLSSLFDKFFSSIGPEMEGGVRDASDESAGNG